MTGRKARYGEFEPATWVLGLLGRQISAGEYARALRSLQRAARQIGAFFEKYDVPLTPTLATPPIEIGWLQPTGIRAFALKLLGSLNAGALLNKLAGIEALAEEVFAFIPFTPVFNVTGQPAMSVPLVWNDEGLPIGMHFAARFGEEATLFRLAAQLEKARPWFDRRPPVCG
ncbi:MAG: 6-aminohexanoate-cyclic-dimer hydrolase [Thermoflexia bacterium]|nr:MAG: 6-aminohexanoate-cyclic-dimer hydrolase [Thermoflexia bacterium]